MFNENVDLNFKYLFHVFNVGYTTCFTKSATKYSATLAKFAITPV